MNKKHMKTGKEESLDAAGMKWYVQKRSNGVNVRGNKILAAAGKFAAHLGVSDFKGNEGWLWQFRNRHGLFNKVLHGEAGDADENSVAPFVRSRKSLLVMKGFLPKFITKMKQAFFSAPCLKISRYAAVRKMPRGKKSSKERLSLPVGIPIKAYCSW